MPPRTLAIGDIHGCLTHLELLLDDVAPTAADHLILLGDYVDRGPESAGVIRRICALSRQTRVSAIMGNHEQMMLAARESQERLSDWIYNGGDATLRSYGGVRGTLDDIPAEVWDFLANGLVPYVETDTHLFVHAGAYPDHAMSDQPDYMLRWERFDRIAPHESGKTIVCGHTPQKSGKPANRGYAICLDTFACGGGPLTCLDTGSGKLWQATDDGNVDRSHISDYD